MRPEDAVAIVQHHPLGRGRIEVRANRGLRAAKVDVHVGQPAAGSHHQRFVANIELAAALQFLVDFEFPSLRRLAVVDESSRKVAPVGLLGADDGRRGKTGRQHAGGGASQKAAAAELINVVQHGLFDGNDMRKCQTCNSYNTEAVCTTGFRVRRKKGKGEKWK